MNTTFTIDELTAWISGLIEAAKNDEQFDVAWFKPTETSPMAIVGGWQGGFIPKLCSDMFCESKQNPGSYMCVKIVINSAPLSCTFADLRMPVCLAPEEEDNTQQILEWHEDPELIAAFFYGEWQRMDEAWECGVYKC